MLQATGRTKENKGHLYVEYYEIDGNLRNGKIANLIGKTVWICSRCGATAGRNAPSQCNGAK